MDVQKIIFLVINVVGGLAVIGSYVYGIMTHPGMLDSLWGKISPAVKSFNYVIMPLAVIGYLLLTYFILFQIDAKKLLIAGTFGFEAINVIFFLILIPSTFWMSLTFGVIENPVTGPWWAVRTVLFIVGLASLALVVSLLASNIREPGWAYWLAVAGSILFFIQTGINDAFIWAGHFPHG
ncbi:MAG: hypothetical protein JXA01_04260 [Dehalococcoidia bacterium]|nr:hypothetical protein [Dehalococcoidia bacterium]